MKILLKKHLRQSLNSLLKSPKCNSKATTTNKCLTRNSKISKGLEKREMLCKILWRKIKKIERELKSITQTSQKAQKSLSERISMLEQEKINIEKQLVEKAKEVSIFFSDFNTFRQTEFRRRSMSTRKNIRTFLRNHKIK